MESCSCDVFKYVGLLVQTEKYLQVVHLMQMNLTKEPLIHTSPVICKLDIEWSFDWVCNFMNGILSQGLFTIAYIYKC
jgi:hypothetical protein